MTHTPHPINLSAPVIDLTEVTHEVMMRHMLFASLSLAREREHINAATFDFVATMIRDHCYDDRDVINIALMIRDECDTTIDAHAHLN